MEITNNAYFAHGEVLFNQAKEEFSRPEEDIVAFSVCQKSHEAISLYLRGFLQINDIEVTKDVLVTELLSLCKDVNSKFDDLNLNLINHKYDTEDVWMNAEHAKAYITLAERTRTIIGNH